MKQDLADRPNSALAALQVWTLALMLIMPAIVIAFLAVPRIVSGFAQEAAYPAIDRLPLDQPMPQSSYADAARFLSHVPPADGGTQLLRAEAAMLAGAPPSFVVPVIRLGLAHAPGSARGWYLLAENLREQDPKRAAAAFVLAGELAPNDYFLIVPRVEAGAALWRYLPQSSQETLLDEARSLTANPNSRHALEALLSLPGGASLVTRALAGHPDEIRALNRRLIRERLGLPEN